MPDSDFTLAEKAFGKRADPALVVSYQSYQDALRFLHAALAQSSGIALLQGPSGSGKSTIAAVQRDWSALNSAVALLDGKHLSPRELLQGMLTQFGVENVSQHDDQMLQQLNSYMTGQVRDNRAPVLIIDNIDQTPTSSLRLLDWLSSLDAGSDVALRIVLTGKGRLSDLLQQDSMRYLAQRRPATYSLNPMSAQESMSYLRNRFIAAGGKGSKKVFSAEVCDDLRQKSRGWPGALNTHAIEVMNRMSELYSAHSAPRIVVTRDGETIAVHELTDRKYVIGRTDLADISIDDAYVSKTHAMLQVFANAIVLLDLNSTNGTTVNSQVAIKRVLRNNDIISLGRYRLKLENAPALDADLDKQIKMTDTITLESLEDLRRARAKRQVTALKNR
ncbi:MAG: FHA domain-containing protein [Woeseiaceae bacterium]